MRGANDKKYKIQDPVHYYCFKTVPVAVIINIAILPTVPIFISIPITMETTREKKVYLSFQFERAQSRFVILSVL